MSVVTYGVTSHGTDIFAVGIVLGCVGWGTSKLLSEGFAALIGLIEYDETQKENDE